MLGNQIQGLAHASQVLYHCATFPQPLSLIFLKSTFKPGVVVHVYNPSIGKPEVGGSQVWGQPELYRETLYQKEF
jgi:hypothetical protein